MSFGGLELKGVPPSATGVLVVDLAALKRNYQRLQQLAPAAEIGAAIKADGYGLGAERVGEALETVGCSTFFVATLDEAAALTTLSPRARIYVLNGLLPATAADFHALGASPVLGNMAEIDEWAASSGSAQYGAALHVDTGMTRLGLSSAEAAGLAEKDRLFAACRFDLVMSHLACADQPTHAKNSRQLALFREATGHLPIPRRSLAASSGVFLGPAYHFDLIRAGIALYGGNPTPGTPSPMEPVVGVYARIAQIREVEAGETVGYGATHRLTRPTRLVTVCAGYADGYFRRLSASNEKPGPSGYIDGHPMPMLGRISMDLVTFDGTDVPPALLERGGFVELLGPNVTADDLAGFADTISYEVLTAIGRRYHRIYVNG